ncbi:MAG: thiamine phosphate synthase [Holophagaceae bacterium]|nr:thiamine phosphate synthase [Holophagaceae bacterium]
MHILAISSGNDIEASRWEAVVNSGIDALMIREKQLDARSLLELGKRIRDIAPSLPIWINGRLDIALALGAGFHGGEEYPAITLPSSFCPLSRPLHSIEQIRERGITDQLLISPVFEVPEKKSPLGVAGLHGILEDMPPWEGKLLALGGINPGNAAELQHRRLDGVALIRGLWDSVDPCDTVGRLRAAWNNGSNWKENKC